MIDLVHLGWAELLLSLNAMYALYGVYICCRQSCIVIGTAQPSMIG